MYEMNHAAVAPMRALADATQLFYRNPLNPLAQTQWGKTIAASCELFERTTRRYAKPEFGLNATTINGVEVPVVENVVWQKPFCDLIRFERSSASRDADAPAEQKLLIVAPMSGHYATLLRGTVEAMLPHHDVYITDWTDARAVPTSDGKFDLDDYIDYVIEMLHYLGEGVHVMAVCQPSVPVLAAAAVMDAANDPALPASMTLMGGPIDTRINPTAVNKLAEEKDLSWFKNNVIMTVPFPNPGVMRSVYPGFLQLSGFMSMNLDRHVSAHKEFFSHLVEGDGDSADKHTSFYDEYMAVMDLTEEFYLQTVEVVFMTHDLPRNQMTHHGERIDLRAIKNIAPMTVEGENDDISGVGQTEAAHTLCVNLTDDMRAHYMQPKVGHYGVFNGSRYRAEIAPRIRDFMAAHNKNSSTTPAKTSVTEAKPVPKAALVSKTEANLSDLLLSKPQGAADDLKKVTGLGPKFETILNQLGIFHYFQIARLSDKQIAELDDKLPFKGRIVRDNWVQQAEALMSAAVTV
ncbi:MAG: polyhydroxyalkanoate depolymerase [Rhizobiales bacterium]|nr:polyhydroxyalkanoate depolymerase [Hyphomicrobiales bacterium]